MKNFLFVFPRIVSYGQYYNFPIGMAYVVSYMKQLQKFNLFCLNLCHHTSSIRDVLSEWIVKNNIDVLCTGSVSCHWNEVERVLTAAKEIKPEIITVVGGAIITSDPEMALSNMPIDFGVIGEGEKTMAELAEALYSGASPSDVKGIAYFDENRKIRAAGARPSINNLDELPFPDYEAFEFDKWLCLPWILQPSIRGLFLDYDEKRNMAEIITSRSCPFSCTFCYHPLGKKYRQRSLDNVFKEIDYLVNRYNIDILNLFDELFSLDINRAYGFINRIKKYNIKWMAQWRIDNVNRDILKELKKSGVFAFSLGVESMSDIVLKSMKKNTTKKKIEETLKLTLGTNISICSNIILGDPAETLETVEESISWHLNHPEYDIRVDFILAIPDSPVYRFALEKNLIKDKLQHIKDVFPIINMTNIPRRDFERLKRKVKYWNITYKNLIAGAVLSSVKRDIKFKGKQIYTFKVKCPQCNNVSQYTHFKFSPKPYFPILCKSCYKNLKIKTGDAFPGDYNPLYSFIFQNSLIVYHLYLSKYKFLRKLHRFLKKSAK